jgi:hypothetical protein
MTVKEIQLLKKGMKFTPTPKRNSQDLMINNNLFCRKLRLQEHFNSQEAQLPDYNIEPIVRNKSTFIPPPSGCELIENTVSYLTKMTKSSSNVENNIKSNINKSEWEALNSIIKDKSIVVKEADKGSTILYSYNG